MTAVEVRGICKEYSSFHLDNVSFNLEVGHITGFIGRNGAGKTTTIKSMLNLVHASSGEVFYFGLPFRGNESEIKSRIGYSTGSANYYPKKKIKEIVDVTRLFFSTWDDELFRKYMNIFELDENKTPSELSDGMKVKFNLVLALSHKAEVLILDEPTSGLDPFSRDELLDIFINLKKKGVSIFFSTHITSDLEKCADDIVYIRQGKIISASSKDTFKRELGREHETLEQVMLRLEKEARDAAF